MRPFRTARRALALALAAPLLVVPLLAGAPPASAAPADPLQRQLDALVAAGATGVSAVVDDGPRTTSYAAGVAVRAPRVPMRPDSRVRTGSTTKTVVAALVLQQVAEGRLRLDDPVGRWLPQVVPDADRITLRHLLQHTSGLRNHTVDPDFLALFTREPDRWWDPRELVAYVADDPALFPPGKGWAYSNTGYVLLGQVLQRATGQSVRELVRDRVVTPLGLTGTAYAGTRWSTPHAHGYAPPALTGGAGWADLSDVDPSWAGAAGALVSTPDDLRRIYQALLQGRLVPPTQLREMQRTVPAGAGLAYGLGLYALSGPCGTVWGHDGAMPGYTTVAFSDASGTRSAVMTVTTELTERTAPLFGAAVGTALCRLGGTPQQGGLPLEQRPEAQLSRASSLASSASRSTTSSSLPVGTAR